jgi:hypothetical protein
MSARSIVMTILLVCLVALLLMGRMHRRTPVQHVGHKKTGSLLHRIDRSERWG